MKFETVTLGISNKEIESLKTYNIDPQTELKRRLLEEFAAELANTELDLTKDHIVKLSVEESEYVNFHHLQVGETYHVVNGCWDFKVLELHEKSVKILIYDGDDTEKTWTRNEFSSNNVTLSSND
ncbi:gp249 [Sphingomonas phage PAU]|uniref:gp249 n=1 Tax=Sphingomonas phage PAU TaxID=1150991 RepID=UPI00025733FF|nr:gp249 [Sphingomonas phage PAU]AFF28247.1 gp249 [Sphingomonas phage PAU]